MNQLRHSLITSLTLWILSSCATDTDRDFDEQSSQVYLFNGKTIAEELHPHVYSIGGCTATFVSDNTLITAGHCVSRGGSVRIGRRITARSLKVIHHPNYSGTGMNDVAVAIFPKDTSKATAPLYFGTLNVDDDVFAVGYGCTNGGGSGGTKREGTAKIASLRGGVIGLRRSSDAPGSGNEVTLCPGDSGGPLFRNQALVGIASFWDGGAGRRSGHADLTQASNREFLRNMVQQHGAVIPGLDAPVPPSTNPTPSTPQTTPPQANLFAAIGEQLSTGYVIYTAAPATNQTMLICAGQLISACKPNAPHAIQSTLRTSNGPQAVFKFGHVLDPMLTPEIVIVALDTAGQVTAARILKFRAI